MCGFEAFAKFGVMGNGDYFAHVRQEGGPAYLGFGLGAGGDYLHPRLVIFGAGGLVGLEVSGQSDEWG